MGSEHNTSQPEPPTAAGVGPVAHRWQAEQDARAEGKALQFTHKDNQRGGGPWYDANPTGALAFDHPDLIWRVTPTATPPTLTDAQCDAIREAVSLRSTYTIDEYRARVRAAVGGAK